MYSFIRALASGLFLSQLSSGAPSSFQSVAARDTENCNTASNRACWISGSYDINTDYELNTPLTGVVRNVGWITVSFLETYQLTLNL